MYSIKTTHSVLLLEIKRKNYTSQSSLGSFRAGVQLLWFFMIIFAPLKASICYKNSSSPTHSLAVKPAKRPLSATYSDELSLSFGNETVNVKLYFRTRKKGWGNAEGRSGKISPPTPQSNRIKVHGPASNVVIKILFSTTSKWSLVLEHSEDIYVSQLRQKKSVLAFFSFFSSNEDLKSQLSPASYFVSTVVTFAYEK